MLLDKAPRPCPNPPVDATTPVVRWSAPPGDPETWPGVTIFAAPRFCLSGDIAHIAQTARAHASAVDEAYRQERIRILGDLTSGAGGVTLR